MWPINMWAVSCYKQLEFQAKHQMASFGVLENDASDSFNLESPKLAHTSIPTSWSTLPDMTSLTTSGQKLQRTKNSRNVASDGFGSNSSAAAFCLPTNWWASCCICICASLLARFKIGIIGSRRGNAAATTMDGDCMLNGFVWTKIGTSIFSQARWFKV